MEEMIHRNYILVRISAKIVWITGSKALKNQYKRRQIENFGKRNKKYRKWILNYKYNISERPEQ